MKTLLGLAACLAICLGLMIVPAASAAPCACSEICCIGPHNPGVTCETECCTLSGWTTCGGWGYPGCESLQGQNAPDTRSSEASWLQVEDQSLAAFLMSASSTLDLAPATAGTPAAPSSEEQVPTATP